MEWLPLGLPGAAAWFPVTGLSHQPPTLPTASGDSLPASPFSSLAGEGRPRLCTQGHVHWAPSPQFAGFAPSPLKKDKLVEKLHLALFSICKIQFITWSLPPSVHIV